MLLRLKRRRSIYKENQPLVASYGCLIAPDTGLADTEHLGAALGADTFGSRTAILHLDGLGFLHDSLGLAFYTIRFH
jgi:hypothetical protein